jgi:16S rRNA (cytidine1402-2'-O)-methyltransferase
MATKLAVVCTPIGNLGDLAPRAAEALAKADIVLCEDTRHSKPLLDRIGARARLISCHAHNERERKDLVVEALQKGERVALVSDAGAPAVSDPGGKIVEEVIAAGLDVEVFPGPSALTAALMGAGIDVSRFAFLGFLPRSGKPRRVLLDVVARGGIGTAVYEAPQRVEETLRDLFEALGARRVVVARELTKLHETFHRGLLGQPLHPPLVEKGEVVILVEGGAAREELAESDIEAIAKDESLPPKERARRIAHALGISVKEAYERVQRAGASPQDSIRRARDLLGAAARALVEADLAARRARGGPPTAAGDKPASSEIPGADELMALLEQGSSSSAPVEAAEAARALLAALSSVDALLDATGWGDDSRSRG